MKKITKCSLKPQNFEYLKNKNYGKQANNKNIVFSYGELQIKYTKINQNKFIKEILHRHIEPIKEELFFPTSFEFRICGLPSSK